MQTFAFLSTKCTGYKAVTENEILFDLPNGFLFHPVASPARYKLIPFIQHQLHVVLIHLLILCEQNIKVKIYEIGLCLYNNLFDLLLYE